MTDIHIRQAAPDDASLLAELAATTFYDTFAASSDPDRMATHIKATYGIEQQSAELADPAVTYLIAEMDGEAIGYAELRAGSPPDRSEYDNAIRLHRIYAAQDWIGKGVGAALMRACLDRADQHGYATIWLGVWDQNARAIAFYEKWGFRVAGRVSYLFGDEVDEDLLMLRPVRQP